MTGKTVAFKKQIYAELSTLCTRVKSRITRAAPKDYPYIVFNKSVLEKKDWNEKIQLEINVVGYGDMGDGVSDLADSVEEMFDHYFYINAAIAFESYLNTRTPIEEQDKEVVRERLLFDVYLTERTEE
jgi:hypothetical protein